MTHRYFRAALLITIISSASACRVVTIVPTGGKVTYKNGEDYCLEGETCPTIINDFSHNETYVAEPNEGNFFHYWKKNRKPALCPGSDQPCTLNSTLAEGSASLEAIIESDERWFMNPKFEEIATGEGCSEFLEAIEIDDAFLGLTFGNCFEIPPSDEFQPYMFGLFTLDFAGPGAMATIGDYENPLVSGDLLVAYSLIDNLAGSPDVSNDEIALGLYIDADDDPDTGFLINGVVGADYRLPVGTDCQIETEEGTIVLPAPVLRWGEETSSWMVWDEDFLQTGLALGGLIYSFDETRVALNAYTNPNDLGLVNMHPRAVMRVEKSRPECVVPGKVKVYNTSPVFYIDSYT